MLITKLKSQIVRAIITDESIVSNICFIDPDLMESANIQQYELVHVCDTTNGTIIQLIAKAGSKNQISFKHDDFFVGDVITISTYCSVSPDYEYNPIFIYVDSENHEIED